MVAEAYNSSFLGDWDWEDHGSRAALAKSFKVPISVEKG
jgi:hypothetical protein